MNFVVFLNLSACVSGQYAAISLKIARQNHVAGIAG
ncbi:MAG: hypothetical protein ACI89D_000428 [Bermanella sp.]|jgi:hypothetical protein